METFFPSEVARLVLGYLKDEKCLKSWQTFLEESSNLEEYCNLYKKGRVYATNVNGNSLLDILHEYCVLKSEVESNSNNKLESPEKSCHISESEFFKTIRNDVFVESTKKAVDSVFQKYFSSSVLNNRNSSSSNPSVEVCPSETSNRSFRNKENQNFQNTDVVQSNADACSDKQNKVLDIPNEINNKIINGNRNKTCYQNIILDNLNSNKSDAELNISEKGNNSVLKQLNVSKNKDLQSSCTVTDIKNSTSTSHFISRQLKNYDSLTVDSANDGCNKNLHSAKNKSVSSEENLSAPLSESTVKVKASSTEVTQIDDDDVELEIIKEIKFDKSNTRIQSNQSGDCENVIISNCLSQSNNPVIHVDANNTNVTVNHTALSSVHSTVTTVNNSVQKVNSSENPVTNAQTNNNTAVEISQSVACDVPNEVNQLNNLECNVNSSNDQTVFNINPSPFLNQPSVVNKMPLAPQRFILPNYSSNGSFINNNSQFYIVLNTPVASNVSGTYVTVPHPVLPAVSTTCVKTSVPAPAITVSNPMLTVAATSTVNKTSLAASKTNLASSHGNSLAALRPEGTEKRSQTGPRALKRVSYAEFSDEDTERHASNSLKTGKRKKTQRKGILKKKTNQKGSLSSADESGQVQKISVNGKPTTEKNDFLMTTVTVLPNAQNESKKKKLKRKYSKKKKGKTVKSVSCDDFLEVMKTKQGATYSKFKNKYHPDCTQICPSNPAKSLAVTTSNEVTVNGIPVSSYSNSQDNSQSVVSKAVSENTSQSAVMNNGRVLKVVLSDIFLEPNAEPDTSCNQCPESYSDLLRHNGNNEDQIIDSELIIQNRRSSRIHKDAKHSNESENVDTVRLQQRIKKKRSSSKGKRESSSSSSFDMTTAVLNSMEEARQFVIDPKKHSASLGLEESNLQKSLKEISAEVLRPKSAFHRVIQDMCENGECIELERSGKVNDKNEENINLYATKNGAFHSSHDVEKNLKTSVHESSENSKNPVALKCHSNNRNMVSNKIAVPCEVITLENSDFEKCSNWPEQDLQQKNEAEKIVSLDVSKKESLDSVNAESVNDFKEEKMLLTNSISSLHHVNVNTRLKTCVARKLNFGETHHSYNSRPLINESLLSAKSDPTNKEDYRNFSHCEVFKTESDTFKSVKIKDENSDFIHQTSETSVFSVLTSISANTKVLGITETHTVTKPHSEILNVSSLRGENIVNVRLPSSSNQPLESQKCALLPSLLTKNLLTKCEKMDKLITETCTVEENSASTVLLSSSIS